MHMAWLRHIGGRLKSDYRYSIGLVYNTFPVPPEGADLSKLESPAQAVLDARAAASENEETFDTPKKKQVTDLGRHPYDQARFSTRDHCISYRSPR